MITILNRKELFVTFDLKIQLKIREALKQENIEYFVKTINQGSVGLFTMATQKARFGSLGEKTSLNYEYKIYVKREDYEQASYVISKIHRD